MIENGNLVCESCKCIIRIATKQEIEDDENHLFLGRALSPDLCHKCEEDAENHKSL